MAGIKYIVVGIPSVDIGELQIELFHQDPLEQQQLPGALVLCICP